MFSLNTVTSALGLSRTLPPAKTAGAKVPSQDDGPQDAASLSGATALVASSTPTPSSVVVKPAKLVETGRESALGALPAEGQIARLLDSKPGAMTQQQRDGCIADLETLNLAGDLKFFDTSTGEYSTCGVAQALEIMGRGQPIFYSGGGRQSPMTPIGSLEKLSAAAQQASLGIVG